MSIVTLRLPEVKYCQETRPSQCAYCQGVTFQRWGGVAKRVKDPHLGEVWVYRYRCCHCRRTFRHYQEGSTGHSKRRECGHWPPSAGSWG